MKFGDMKARNDNKNYKYSACDKKWFLYRFLEIVITYSMFIHLGDYIHFTSALMREPVLQDKRTEHLKFCKCASELIGKWKTAVIVLK